MNQILWTVARFPSGMWCAGGKVTDPDYSTCEVYQIPAENREKATKKAQGIRSRLVKAGGPLPTQSTPYKLEFSSKD